MKKSTLTQYRKRLLKVLDYIYLHLDKELDVNALADVALLSPYHFHRIYRQMAQETVNTTVRRLRLQHAASRLIRSNDTPQVIASQVAYSSVEAFSRAFSKSFGETPSAYRESRQGRELSTMPFIAMLPDTLEEFPDMYDVEITEFGSTQLLGYEHQGDYMEVGSAFEKLFIYAQTHNLMKKNSRSIGIYYDDPKSVDMDKLRSVAGLSVADNVSLPPGFEEETGAPKRFSIPGGKCAQMVFKGSYAELEQPYDWFFGHWLPQSGYEAANFPPFEEYLNDPKTTPPNELLTRIHCLLS